VGGLQGPPGLLLALLQVLLLRPALPVLLEPEITHTPLCLEQSGPSFSCLTVTNNQLMLSMTT